MAKCLTLQEIWGLVYSREKHLRYVRQSLLFFVVISFIQANVLEPDTMLTKADNLRTLPIAVKPEFVLPVLRVRFAFFESKT